MIVAVIAAVLILFVIVLLILQIIPGGASLKGPGYAEGFRAARELAYNAGARPPERTGGFSGVVSSVGASSVTFTAEGLIMDERVDGVGLVRTATVSSETQILLLQERSSEEYDAARQAYLAARDVAGDNPDADIPRPPSRFTEVTISLSDIQPGDRVSITPVPPASTEPSENNSPEAEGLMTYLNAKSFPALRISVTRPEAEPVEPSAEAMEPSDTMEADPMPSPKPSDEGEIMEEGAAPATE